jgi:hypothetical protein
LSFTTMKRAHASIDDLDGETSSSDRPLQILLGVSGSVAALRAPEIAVQLVQESRPAVVQILLTKGGSIFWKKAPHYDPLAWSDFQREVSNKRVVVLGKLR